MCAAVLREVLRAERRAREGRHDGGEREELGMYIESWDILAVLSISEITSDSQNGKYRVQCQMLMMIIW